MNIITMPVGPIGTNCYIVGANGVCAIIDPGDEARRIADRLDDVLGCRPEAILLTHSHYDHTGAVADLQKFYPGTPVYRSFRDDYHGDPRLCQLFPDLENTQEIDEGEELTIGSLTFKVYATPGHSEGSLSFLCENKLFCGDTLFAGSCGRTDMPGGDQEKMWSSLRRLGRLPADTEVYPGHMQSTSIGEELKINPYLQHALRGGEWD